MRQKESRLPADTWEGGSGSIIPIRDGEHAEPVSILPSLDNALSILACHAIAMAILARATGNAQHAKWATDACQAGERLFQVMENIAEMEGVELP